EFMAENGNGLMDEDGAFSDWIEIHNPAATNLNLAGWYLTDDPLNLTRWTFPSTPLASNGYLLVFASSKNRAVAGNELHTDFSLDNDGEFLALVEPDGLTIASRFAPYPAQATNISYGFGFGPIAAPVDLVPADGFARLLIPTGPVSPDWRGGAPFNDSSWTQAQLGVGFNIDGGPVVGSGALRITAYDIPGGTAGNQNYGGALGMDFFVTQPIALHELGVFDDDSDGLNRTITAEIWSRNDGGTVENPNDDSAGVVLTSEVFSAGSPGVLVNGSRFKPLAQPLILPPGAYTMVAHGYGSGESNGNTGGGGDFGIGNDGGGLIGFTGNSRFGPAGSWPTSVDGGPEIRYGAGSFVYSASGDPSIRTDLENTQYDRNATVLLRIPFVLSDTNFPTNLVLNIAWDDGFDAYINGVPIASRNAPGSPLWNSTATSTGNLSEAINLGPLAGLTLGTNILAIQGLNITSNDRDFIIAPELIGEQTRREMLHFVQPSPGQPNPPGHYGTGIVINEIHYDPRAAAGPAEFIELYNAGSSNIDLTGWMFTDGINYTFPPGTVLTTGDYLVVALDLTGFSNVFPGVAALGPYGGKLNNQGEEVDLRNATGLLIDQVNYNVGAPWPVASDDPYSSVQLLHPGLNNNLGG
ncbi:MAG: lamin tail domain-containing protein, partial [Verrucomicrobiota bacterium]